MRGELSITNTLTFSCTDCVRHVLKLVVMITFVTFGGDNQLLYSSRLFYGQMKQTIGGQRKCFHSEFHALSDHQKTKEKKHNG